jgi:hypothetical protein
LSEDTEAFDDVDTRADTEMAVLCLIDGDEHWIPRSVIVGSESEVNEVGDKGTLVIKSWFARKLGLV